MRVLYFNYLYDADGVSLGSSVKIRRLVRGLEELGHQVQTAWLNPHACLPSGGVAPHRRPIRHWLHRYFAVPKALLRNVQALPREQRNLKRGRPDVLIVRLDFCRLSAAWLARRFGIPLVIDADAPVLEELRRFHPEIRVGRFVAPISEQWVLKRADRVFTPSAVGRELLIRSGASADRTIVIPNGADVLERDPELRVVTRRELGYSSDQPVIGFVGAFNRFHGIENLLSAFRQLSSSHPKARLLLVGGGGDHEPAVRRAAEGNPAILATGRVGADRVRELLQAMDVGVAPYSPQSDFYFSPVKLFEYMAAGLPVVAPPLGQIGELLESGQAGIPYDPTRPEALAQALRAALDQAGSERERIGARARRIIREGYTWEHAAERLSRVLEEARSSRAQSASSDR